MSTAEQIIAEVIARAMVNALGADGGVYVRDDDGLDDVLLDGRADMLEVSAHVVAALTNAGKTIVDLPEGETRGPMQVWLAPTGGGYTAATKPGSGMVTGLKIRMTAEEARAVGADLLAAARVAEGGDQP